jgi:TPR repeat protein
MHKQARRPLPSWFFLGGILLVCLCVAVGIFLWVLHLHHDPVAFREALQEARNAESPQFGLQQVELLLQDKLTAEQRAEVVKLQALLARQVALAQEQAAARCAAEQAAAQQAAALDAQRVELARRAALTAAAPAVAVAPERDVAAMYAKGAQWMQGDGVVKNEVEGLLLIGKAAAAGLREAQHDLAAIQAAGTGGTTNLAAALSWARSAAQQGDAEAQAWLGYCLGSGYGGVPVDPVQALQWNEKAGAQGSLPGLVNLAVQYANGYGVRLDSARAAEYFARAASRGHADAQVSLGVMCLKGVGVAANPTNAVSWFRKAHEQGHVQGTFALGLSHLGGSGVPKDRQMAAACFLAAARQGHVGAQKQIGRMFLSGNGVPCSEQDAFYWFGRAAAQGDAYARQVMGSYSNLLQQSSVRARCEVCAGQGAKMLSCAACGGSGTFSQTTTSRSIRNCSCGWQMINGRCPNCGKSENLSRTVTSTCATCQGAGRVRMACSRCGGAGVIQMAAPDQTTLSQLVARPDAGLALAVESAYLPVRLQPFRAGVRSPGGL